MKLVICTLFFLLSINIFSKEEFSFTTTNYPPYISESLPFGGILGKYLTQFSDEQGIELKVSYATYPRSIYLIEQEKIDFILTTLNGFEYFKNKKDLVRSNSAISIKACLIYKKDLFKNLSTVNLHRFLINKKVISIGKIPLNDILRKKNIYVEPIGSVKSAIKMIISERADFFTSTYAAFKFLEMKTPGLNCIPYPHTEEIIFVSPKTSKGSKYIKEFNKFLKENDYDTFEKDYLNDISE